MMPPLWVSVLQEVQGQGCGQGRAGWQVGQGGHRRADRRHRLRSSPLARTVSGWGQALPNAQASYFLPVRWMCWNRVMEKAIPRICMMRMHIPTVPRMCLLSSNHSFTFS